MNKLILCASFALLFLFNASFSDGSDSINNVMENNQDLLIAAKAGDVDAQFKLGELSVSKKDAKYWFRKAAQQGNVQSILKLGELLIKGMVKNATASDVSEAIRWYQLAADKGNPEAKRRLGKVYIEQKDDRGVAFLKELAAEGYIPAMLDLHLNFKKSDPTESKLWVDEIIKNLGDEITEEDYVLWGLLFSFDIKALEREEKLPLVKLHYNNIATEQEKAIKDLWIYDRFFSIKATFEVLPASVFGFFEKASKQGDDFATYSLARINHLLSRGNTRNEYRRLAEKGFLPAMHHYGLLCLKGEGGAKNIEEGLRMLESAAERGLWDSAASLIGFYSDESNSFQDKERVAFWKNFHASKGIAEAQYRVAQLYKCQDKKKRFRMSARDFIDPSYRLITPLWGRDDGGECGANEDYLKWLKLAAEKNHEKALSELVTHYKGEKGSNSEYEDYLSRFVETGNESGALAGILYALSHSSEYKNFIENIDVELSHIGKFLEGGKLTRSEKKRVIKDIKKNIDSYIRETDFYGLEASLVKFNGDISYRILEHIFRKIDRYKSRYYYYQFLKVTDPESLVSAAITNFKQSKHKDLKLFELAVTELMGLAETYSKASRTLGIMYSDGINTDVDLIQAEKYFKLCSKLGDSGACDYSLAQMNREASEDNYRYYLKRAADKGDLISREILKSEMNVGHLKNVDVHVEKNIGFFPVLFEKSADEDLLIRADKNGRIITSQLSSGRSIRDYTLGEKLLKIYYVGGMNLLFVKEKGLGLLNLNSGEIEGNIDFNEQLSGFDYSYLSERLLISTEGRVVKLYDSGLNELKSVLNKNDVDINIRAISDDATKYASVSGKTVSIGLYDMETNSLLDEIHIIPTVNYMKFLDADRLLISINEDPLYKWHHGMDNNLSGLCIYSTKSKQVSYIFPDEEQQNIDIYETGLFFTDNTDQYYSWDNDIYKIVGDKVSLKNRENVRLLKERLVYFEKNIVYVYEKGLFLYELDMQKKVIDIFLIDEGAMVIHADGTITQHDLKKDTVSDLTIYYEMAGNYSEYSKFFKYRNSITLLNTSGNYYEYSLKSGKEISSGRLDNIPLSDVVHMRGDDCIHYNKDTRVITLLSPKKNLNASANLDRDPEKFFSYNNKKFLKYEDGTIAFFIPRKDGDIRFPEVNIRNLVPSNFYTVFDYDHANNILTALDTKSSHLYKWELADGVRLVEDISVPFGSGYYVENDNNITFYDVFGGTHSTDEENIESDFVVVSPPATLGVDAYLNAGFIYAQSSYSIEKSIDDFEWRYVSEERPFLSTIGFVDIDKIDHRKEVSYDNRFVLKVMDIGDQMIAVFNSDFAMKKYALELRVDDQVADRITFDLSGDNGYAIATYDNATGLFIVETREAINKVNSLNVSVYGIDDDNKFGNKVSHSFDQNIKSFSLGVTSGGKLIYLKVDESGVSYIDLHSLQYHDVNFKNGGNNLFLAEPGGHLIKTSYIGDLIVYKETSIGFDVAQTYEGDFEFVASASGYGDAIYLDLNVSKDNVKTNANKHKLIKYRGGKFEEVHDYFGPYRRDLGRYYVNESWDYKIQFFDKKTDKYIDPIEYYKPVKRIDISKNQRLLYILLEDGAIDIFDIESRELLFTYYALPNKQWIALTPEGFFNASPAGASYLNVRIGRNVYGIDQFHDVLYRPDLVDAKVQGDPMGLVAKAAEKINLEKLLAQGSAPRIKFTSHKSGESSDRDIKPEIEIIEKGGGIGKVLWKLNGTTIGVEEPAKGRELEIDESLSTSKRLTLSPGENVIEVVAYNKDGGMASDPYTLRLNLKDDISEVPSLHILAVGVNKYRDKSLWLNYAVPDSKDLVTSIQSVSNTIFDAIYVDEIYDKDATLADIEQAFVKVSRQAKTSDVFVLYLAGHGITLDGRYHFLPVDFRYRNEDSVRDKAINQDHLQKWMSQIPARKSLVLLDTCNSGSFVQAQAVTRGLEEKVAIEKLTRATGRATIAASSDSQVALEGYEGHGVFTYALMKALKDADGNYGNRDGITTTMEIANYVDEQVPDITYNKWGYEQVPQVNLHGRQFPIGVAAH